jgi:hypothetical protein
MRAGAARVGAAVNRGRALAAAALLAAGGAAAAPGTGGDLCFPLEGWALVARSHVGSGLRSAREGWVRRSLPDRSWARLAPGRALPDARAGVWLRGAFAIGRAWKARHVTLALAGLPEQSRIWLNGVELDPGAFAGGRAADVTAHVRIGTNQVAVAARPPAKAPTGIARVRVKGGSDRTLPLGSWRVRADALTAEIPEDWLRAPHARGWRFALPRPLAAEDDWLPDAPVCLKAVLDFPREWKGRPVAVFLHEAHGEPALFVNGRRLAEGVRCPARVDLKGALAFDGFDTLCLVYRTPPRGPAGTRPVVALRWDAVPPRPGVPEPARLAAELGGAADGPELRQALRLAAEIAAVSASPYALEWTDTATASGAVVAEWAVAPFGSPALATARRGTAQRASALAAAGLRTWIVAPPTAGTRPDASANLRIRDHNEKLRRDAERAGAGFVPVAEVFRSALRRSRRWRVQAVFSDDEGRLTPLGSFLAAATLLDTLAAR